MSKGFGKRQAAVDSGVWKNELKLADGEGATVIPLHGLDECLEVWVHARAVKLPGRGFSLVTSGDRNGHLFNPVSDPFNSHPDKEVQKTRLVRFMLVYVDKGKLEGHVAFLELKKGIYDSIKNWLEAQASEGENPVLENTKWRLTRTGKGQQDTKYGCALITANASLAWGADLEAELDKVRTELEKTYIPDNVEETLKLWYTQSLSPSTHEPRNEVETPAKNDDDDIPF